VHVKFEQNGIAVVHEQRFKRINSIKACVYDSFINPMGYALYEYILVMRAFEQVNHAWGRGMLVDAPEEIA